MTRTSIGFTVNPIRFRNTETGKVGHYCEKVSPGCKNCYASRMQKRPMHPAWAKSVCDQCQAAGVPFFFKQWGEFAPTGPLSAHQEIVCGADGWHAPSGNVGALSIHHMERHNGEMECPPLQNMYRVGKKAAGRLLDGRTWDEMPEML
jgi:protein gp37